MGAFDAEGRGRLGKKFDEEKIFKTAERKIKRYSLRMSEEWNISECLRLSKDLRAELDPTGKSAERLAGKRGPCFQARADVALSLTRAGANLEHEANDGFSILELAAMHDVGSYPWFRGEKPARPLFAEMCMAAGTRMPAARALALACEMDGRRGTLCARVALEGGADPNGTGDSSGILYLAQAAQGNEGTVRLLLARGANPNGMDKRIGCSALHGANEASTKLLLAHGVNANVVNHRGETPLHWAWDGRATRLLLAAGGNPNARDELGRTPLFHAWRPCVVKALLAGGADPLAEDAEGRTAEDDLWEGANWESWLIVVDAAGKRPLIKIRSWGESSRWGGSSEKISEVRAALAKREGRVLRRELADNSEKNAGRRRI